jgi:hypothetical protein
MEIGCKKCEKNGTILQHGTAVLKQTGIASCYFSYYTSYTIVTNNQNSHSHLVVASNNELMMSSFTTTTTWNQVLAST